jgi:tetratricopeptide (TPR) repeat protein
LAISQARLGPQHPQVIGGLNNLGSALFAMHQYEEAETMFEQALALCEKSREPNYTYENDTLRNLADMYRYLQRDAKASEYYKRAIELREQIFGAHSPLLAADLEAYAVVLRRMQDFAGAEKASVRALGIQVRNTLHP